MPEKRKRRPGGGRKPKPGEKRKLVALRMLPSLKRQLEHAAAAHKRSFNAEIEFRLMRPSQVPSLRPAHIAGLGDAVMMLAALIEGRPDQPGAGPWLTPSGGIALRAGLDRLLTHFSSSPEKPIEPDPAAEDIGRTEAGKLISAIELQRQVMRTQYDPADQAPLVEGDGRVSAGHVPESWRAFQRFLVAFQNRR
jgi:hypothetical protein